MYAYDTFWICICRSPKDESLNIIYTYNMSFPLTVTNLFLLVQIYLGICSRDSLPDMFCDYMTLSNLASASAASDMDAFVFAAKDPSLLPQHILSPPAAARTDLLELTDDASLLCQSRFLNKPFCTFSLF